MIPGIDVSHWQKVIDWKLVKKAGVRFAFFKATEFPPRSSKLFIDQHLAANAAGTSENRIHAAPYHFYQSHVSALTQAFAFLDTIKDLSFSLRPVLDLEASKIYGFRLTDEILIFCEAVKDSIGRLPIIYTSSGFWNSYILTSTRKHAQLFTGYTLWLAQWGFTMPRPLFPFASASFWQYSQTGRIPGISTPVDLNWFMGGEIEMLAHLYLNRPAVKKTKSAERLDT